MTWSAFWSFRRMITPLIIQIIFAVSVAATTVAGLVAIITGIRDNNRGAAFIGLAVLIFAPLVARIYCELTIVVFRINETLADLLELQQAGAEDPPESVAAQAVS